MPGTRGKLLSNNLLRSILLLLAGISLHMTGVAQISLNGIVTLGSTGKPLAGVHIAVPSLNRGTVSDSAGRFHIEVSAKGTVHLKATYVGCHPLALDVSVRELPVPLLELKMEDLAVLMNEVVITEDQPELRRLNVPMRIARISSDVIRDSPGRQITEVLDQVSGVNLSSTTGMFGGGQVVSMRGLSGNDQGRTLILLDGVPLNKADGGSVNWNRINRENIREIIVVKGPGAAKYGSNAMGGVIEMVSERSSKTLSGSLTASYGTYETFRANYSLGGMLKPKSGKGLFYNLNGFYTRSAGYNPEVEAYLEPGDTFQVNTYLREALLGFRAGYDFGKGHEIEAAGEIYNDKRGRGMVIYETDGSWDQHKNYLIRLRYTGAAGRFNWQVSGFYNQEGFRRMNEFMSDMTYNLYLVRSGRTDLGAAAAASMKAGRFQTISAGLEFRKGGVYGQDIYYTSTDLITNAGDIELYALYIQDEVSLAGGKLRINGGLRLNAAVFRNGLFTIEYPSYSIEYLSDFQDTLIPDHAWGGVDPKLSLQYQFNPLTRIYLSFGKGFRAPNLDDLCRTGRRSDGLRIANPALGPENLYNLELGADATLFKHLHLSGSVYYSVGYDFIYTVATGDSVNMGYKIAPITQKRNISEVHLFGGELDASLSIWKTMQFSAGYSLSLSRIVSSGAAAGDSTWDLTGNALVDVPVHKVSAGFGWTNRILSFNITYKYVSPRWINDQNTTDLVLGTDRFPAYQILSARVWHTFFNKLTVAFDAENIFDVRYIDSHYQQNPGRMLTGEINFHF